MKLSDFDFDFNEDLIALSPIRPAHHSKMLVVQDGNFQDKQTIDLPDFLTEKDCLVFNNTKVIKARLNGNINTKGRSASLEITLHKMIKSNQNSVLYSAFAKGSKKLKQGDDLFFGNEEISCHAKLIDKNIETGEVIIEFLSELENFFHFLDICGTMPLPPYIAKKRASDKTDDSLYQPIFAKHSGSVAAPTASLHFDEIIMQKIKDKNIQTAFVTLHVGGGTFLPVKTENISEHIMHSEYAEVSEETVALINKVKKDGGRIIPVGTTALRTIESATNEDGIINSFCGHTDIFITPSYKFKIADILMTNFHLPKSTLFMLVCALAGFEEMHKAYKYAQENNYRFFSYGDACLLFKKQS